MRRPRPSWRRRRPMAWAAHQDRAGARCSGEVARDWAGAGEREALGRGDQAALEAASPPWWEVPSRSGEREARGWMGEGARLEIGERTAAATGGDREEGRSSCGVVFLGCVRGVG